MANNVYSSAEVLKPNEDEDTVEEYQLGTFFGKSDSDTQTEVMKETAKLSNTPSLGAHDPLLAELKKLTHDMGMMKSKIDSIENNGVNGKDLDKQVVEAIKDLKHYASFFEQATFQLESKILKTSMSIAQKIIKIEVGENSATIAKETISNMLNKIKTASKISIHLNPRDYAVLKNDLQFEAYIELFEDSNVAAGGVVIASDLGNFDGNIEAKVNSMLESLDSVI
ncbi:MAG: FliH/SctL family protein [Campylobacterota bacterium]|nr:FliH/SctL family protein [Campylobacterota bacterium]